MLCVILLSRFAKNLIGEGVRHRPSFLIARVLPTRVPGRAVSELETLSGLEQKSLVGVVAESQMWLKVAELIPMHFKMRCKLSLLK